MAVRHESLKFTYRDYCKLPEDLRVELIGGEFLMTPAPGTPHQGISIHISARLYQWVARNKLGKVFSSPTGVVLSDHDVVQPDILFISNERAGIVNQKNIAGAPDLVIEILSSSTAGRDQITKKSLYARHGVKECWIVNPKARTIAVFVLRNRQFRHRHTYVSGNVIESAVVSGFKISVKEIFE